MNEGLYDGGPTIPPTGGFREPERRQKPRRTDDQIQQDMEGWVARFIARQGGRMALVALATALVTAVGLRIVGPSQDIKALDQKFTAKDSIMSVRVSRIEDSQAQIKAQLASIAEAVRFLTYLQCTQIDRDKRPSTCYVRGTEP